MIYIYERRGVGVKVLYVETRVKSKRVKDFSWEYPFFTPFLVHVSECSLL